MSTRLIVVAALVLAVALAGAGAVYAYDQDRRDLIARGVTVDGVPVGGLTSAQARAKVRAALLDPLRRPVVVRHAGERFTLRPADARVRLDVRRSVARALAVSRHGGILARTWRDLRDEAVDRDVTAQVRWSRRAVHGLVARVGKAIDRPAVDATLDLSGGRVDPQPSREGVAVRRNVLRRAVRRTLLSKGPRRPVPVRTAVVRPAVTSEELAEKYPAVLIVNRGSFSLTLYRNLKLARTYPIAVGMQGLETPAGLYHIQNKAVDPAWTMPHSDWVAPADRGKVVPGGSPKNPLKARWLGIYAGAGIHGIDPSQYGTIGHAASHGCVRMRIPDVIDLYDQVPVGAPIYIS